MKNIPLIHKYYGMNDKCLNDVNALFQKYGMPEVTNPSNKEEIIRKLNALFLKYKNNDEFLSDYMLMHPDRNIIIWAYQRKHGDFANCDACPNKTLSTEGKTAQKTNDDQSYNKTINTVLISGAILVTAMVLVKILK